MRTRGRRVSGGLFVIRGGCFQESAGLKSAMRSITGKQDKVG